MQGPISSLTPLVVPAWLVAISVVAVGSIRAFIWLRREAQEGKPSGGLSNGALARLDRAERDIVESERRMGEEMRRLREDAQSTFADVRSRFDRWDERWDDWQKNRGRA